MDRKTNFIKGRHDHLLGHLKTEFGKSKLIDINVAFAFSAGVALLREDLEDLISRKIGGPRTPVRILVGDYLDATEPKALREILQLGDGVDLRIFETTSGSFHPKSFIFHYEEGGGAAYVGSSNLSRSALVDGIEWNYRISSQVDNESFEAVKEEFEALFNCDQVKHVDEAWIQQYEARRIERPIAYLSGDKGLSEEQAEQELPPGIVRPHHIQLEALDALKLSREQNEKAGLAVLATGLGKTWLAAFDSHQFKRVLFVAHREEILNQAFATFSKICPDMSLGFLRGGEHDWDVDILFASIQTLKNHLDAFAPDYFDYVIVDEFHHAPAASYQRAIKHFEPEYLLGLTATPERMDGGNVLALCHENVVYQCNLLRGIEEELLSPFHYFGVPDDIDYENIPWRSGKFDVNALTNEWAIETRAKNAFEELENNGGSRTLCFCCSLAHANYMKEYFNMHGRRAAVVHSGEGSDDRSESITKLKDGAIDVICAVDIFNEGVDIPNVDTVLMLRPTESPIIWAQQFGRGLRRLPNKTLKVIDYIGNHKSFLEKTKTLFMVNNERELERKLKEREDGVLELPLGCEITYDLEAISILQQLVAQKLAVTDQRELFYDEYKEANETRPLIIHAYNAGVLNERKPDGSPTGGYRKGWLGIVKDHGDLPAWLEDGIALDFLNEIEKTLMNKLFKMVVLKGMLEYGIDRPASVVTLREFFKQEMLSNQFLAKELETHAKSDALLDRCLRDNPIKAWLSRKNSKGEKYFKFESDAISLAFAITPDCLEEFSSYVSELVDYRLIRESERYASNPHFINNLRELILHDTYKTNEIRSYFLAEDYPGSLMQGYLRLDNDNIIKVNLKKTEDTEEHLRYKDRFVDKKTFRWESRGNTTRESDEGQSITQDSPNKFHLFVRETPTGSPPFIYCGEVRRIEYKNECPIQCTFELVNSLSDELFERFKVAQPVTED